MTGLYERKVPDVSVYQESRSYCAGSIACRQEGSEHMCVTWRSRSSMIIWCNLLQALPMRRKVVDVKHQKWKETQIFGNTFDSFMLRCIQRLFVYISYNCFA